jgi:hypothetical protein
LVIAEMNIWFEAKLYFPDFWEAFFPPFGLGYLTTSTSFFAWCRECFCLQ